MQKVKFVSPQSNYNKWQIFMKTKHQQMALMPWGNSWTIVFASCSQMLRMHLAKKCYPSRWWSWEIGPSVSCCVEDARDALESLCLNTTQLTQETDQNHGLFKSFLHRMVDSVLNLMIAKSQEERENHQGKAGTLFCNDPEDELCDAHQHCSNEDLDQAHQSETTQEQDKGQCP